MIKVIGNEMYRIGTTLENALGREPTERDYSRFEVLAEEALNNVIKQMVKEKKPAPQVPAEPPSEKFTQYAYVRPDIVEADELPPIYNLDRDEEHYLPEELLTTKFPCYQQPEDLEDTEYNVMIILPDGKLYMAVSTDFEYMDIEKSIYEVPVTRIGIGNRTLEISARTQEEAEKTALETAGDYHFSEHYADYEIN